MARAEAQLPPLRHTHTGVCIPHQLIQLTQAISSAQMNIFTIFLLLLKTISNTVPQMNNLDLSRYLFVLLYRCGQLQDNGLLSIQKNVFSSCNQGLPTCLFFVISKENRSLRGQDLVP